MIASLFLHLRRRSRLYLLGTAGLTGLLIWVARPPGWWRVELLIRAQPRQKNGWNLVDSRDLVGFLDEGRSKLFSPGFFAVLDGLEPRDVRPVAVEQFRCTSIFDVAIETRHPELRPATATNAATRLIEAMRAKYPNVEFEFLEHRLTENPSPLQRILRALSP